MVLSNLGTGHQRISGFNAIFLFCCQRERSALKVDQLDQEFLFVEGISSGIDRMISVLTEAK